MDALWHQPLVRALEYALAGFLWQGTAVALAVAGLLAVLPREAARARYATACLGLGVMAVLPVVAFLSALGQAGPGVLPESLADTWTRPFPAPTVAMSESLALAAPAAAPRWEDVLRPWLLSAWACGVLLLSLRTALAWLYASRLSREETRAPAESWTRALAVALERVRVSRPVRLLESFRVEVPVVVGVWRPLILVPVSALAGLAPAQLEALLSHELAHIRRHDALVNLLQTLVETALFYHPAVWWLSRRIREEREHCADDLAVRGCGDVLLYVRALADIEQLRAVQPRAGVGAGGGSLLARIRRLLAVPEHGAARQPWRLAGAFAASALVVLLGASRGEATPDVLASAAREQLAALVHASVPPMLEPHAPLLPMPERPAPVPAVAVARKAPPVARAPKGSTAPVPSLARARPAMPLLIPETGALSRAALPRKPFSLEPEPEPLPLGLPDLPTLVTQVASGWDGEDSSQEHVLWLGEGITRPRMLSGEPLVYPRQVGARAQGYEAEDLEGSVVARCTLTPEGTLEDCKLLKRLEAVDSDVLRVLSTRRYTPAIYQGRPVPVNYVVNIQFAMATRTREERLRLLQRSPEGPRCTGCMNVSFGPAPTLVTSSERL